MTTVPIIVVITKFDLFIKGMSIRGKLKGPNTSQAAAQTFKLMFGHRFEKGGISLDLPIPYALVSSMFAPDITPSALTMCSIYTRNLAASSENYDE